MNTFEKIISEFSLEPREIHTVPLNNVKCKWFYVCVEDGVLFVDKATNKMPSCNLKRRCLPSRECEKMLEIYHRRANGERVSTEATNTTRSKVYWYGIFSALKL